MFPSIVSFDWQIFLFGKESLTIYQSIANFMLGAVQCSNIPETTSAM